MPKYAGPEGLELFSPEALTAGEILSRWKLESGSIAAKSDGEPVDLTAIIENDSSIEPIAFSSQAGLDILRHSTSHLMAQAVQRLFPGTRLGIGPSIQDDFYYDMEVDGTMPKKKQSRI